VSAGAPAGPVTVLLNGKAGARRDAAAAVEEALRAAGLPARVRTVRGPALGAAAAAAVREGARMVVAGGGDGTVNAVASALVDARATLGVLPLGTLNHFARDLGIPVGLEAAVAVLAGGRDRRVDAGELNGRLFLNNASLGLYPEIVRLRESGGPHTRAGKMVALAWATLKALRRHPSLDVRVDAGGRSLSLRTPFAFIGNNAYVLEGLALGARASLHEGVLSLYTAHDEGRLGLLRLAARAIAGRLRDAPAFTSLVADGLVVETSRRRLAVALDGEVHHFETPLRCRSRPGALCVRVPPGPAREA
jgi:diacylglycerol kinase family enzyme